MVETAFEFFYSIMSICSVLEEGGPGTGSMQAALRDGIRTHREEGDLQLETNCPFIRYGTELMLPASVVCASLQQQPH